MTRPACYDRPPAPDGRWHQRVPAGPGTMARWRWYPRWYADRCAAWDTAATTPPVPRAEGWACAGCRWLPEGAR
jgi:hypothetical protein